MYRKECLSMYKVISSSNSCNREHNVTADFFSLAEAVCVVFCEAFCWLCTVFFSFGFSASIRWTEYDIRQQYMRMLEC